MWNLCNTDDLQFSEFSRFYKTYRDFIQTEFDLSNKKEELDNRSNLENFFNENKELIIEKMSK